MKSPKFVMKYVFVKSWIEDELVKRNRTHRVTQWYAGLEKKNGNWKWSDGNDFSAQFA